LPSIHAAILKLTDAAKGALAVVVVASMINYFVNDIANIGVSLRLCAAAGGTKLRCRSDGFMAGVLWLRRQQSEEQRTKMGRAPLLLMDGSARRFN
jgi:hypothetical protein